ncbi:MAG: hypothetical protein KME20_18505 [Kaiparowitsia implicata GSE-PSE-MK54-09C]|nr:hypothetical protein [Kaiparowitsia implicata GSE-PSE-MK54-09C]
MAEAKRAGRGGIKQPQAVSSLKRYRRKGDRPRNRVDNRSTRIFVG